MIAPKPRPKTVGVLIPVTGIGAELPETVVALAVGVAVLIPEPEPVAVAVGVAVLDPDVAVAVAVADDEVQLIAKLSYVAVAVEPPP